MANACGLFGDLVPNIYIDRIFLEESQRGVDTDSDGKDDVYLQTPSITVELKVIDTLSDSGTFSILGDALEIQNQNGTVDFKQYFKIRCIMFTSDETAQEFITKFEDGNYTDTTKYLSSWFTGENYDKAWFEKTKTYQQVKTLDDFKNTYVNGSGEVEIINPFTFKLEENTVIDYLRIFAFVELDTALLGQDLINGEVPDAYKNVISVYSDQLVIQNSQTVSQLTIFTTESGNLWSGAVHVHDDSSLGRIYMEGRRHVTTPHNILTKRTTTISNVQDFRIRDQIAVVLADSTLAFGTQGNFPQQKEILRKTLSNKAYFSELFITKDNERNVRFCFAFDYGAYVLENIKFSSLVSIMTPSARKKIVDNSKIVGFTVSRTQVQERPARNHLGSPIQNRVFSDSTMKTPITSGSLGDPNMSEVNILLPNFVNLLPEDSKIRHFTGIDTGAQELSDGAFQYSVDIEILDGFIPVMQESLINLSNAIVSYSEYISLLNIPNVYDVQARKFTPTGQTIMSSFGINKLNTIVDLYLETLDMFVDIDVSHNGTTLRDELNNTLKDNVSPTIGTVDGILQFEDLMNDLLIRINNALGTGSNAVGVEATTTDRQANSISSFKITTIKVSEDFENTIDARFLNESYLDNINTDAGQFSGLNIYSGLNLVEAQPAQYTPESQVLSAIDQLSNNNITVSTLQSAGVTGPLVAEGVADAFNASTTGTPSIPLTDGTDLLLSETKPVASSEYLGSDSGGSFENLNIKELSPVDLGSSFSSQNNESKVQQGVLTQQNIGLSALTALLPLPQSTEPLLSVEDLKYEVDILVSYSVMMTEGARDRPDFFSPLDITQTYMIRNAVFHKVSLGSLGTDETGKYYLCRQTRRSDVEVVDCYFLLDPTAIPDIVDPPDRFTSEIDLDVVRQRLRTIDTQNLILPGEQELETERAQRATEQRVDRTERTERTEAGTSTVGDRQIDTLGFPTTTKVAPDVSVPTADPTPGSSGGSSAGSGISTGVPTTPTTPVYTPLIPKIGG